MNLQYKQLKPVIDHILQRSKADAELAEGIAYIRNRAIAENRDPYDLMSEMLIRHCNRVRAREWMKSKA